MGAAGAGGKELVLNLGLEEEREEEEEWLRFFHTVSVNSRCSNRILADYGMEQDTTAAIHG